MLLINLYMRVCKRHILFFSNMPSVLKQSPDFAKPGLCHVRKSAEPSGIHRIVSVPDSYMPQKPPVIAIIRTLSLTYPDMVRIP